MTGLSGCRRAKDLGLEFPEVTVEYNKLTVSTDALVGNSAMPTLTNSILTGIKVGCAACCELYA